MSDQRKELPAGSLARRYHDGSRSGRLKSLGCIAAIFVLVGFIFVVLLAIAPGGGPAAVVVALLVLLAGGALGLAVALKTLFAIVKGLRGERFSLRTLIIFQLLVGCAVAAWIYRAPWRIERKLPDQKGSCRFAVLSRDARFVATCHGEGRGRSGTVAVWDARTAKIIGALPGSAVGAEFSPDGSLLAAWVDGTPAVRLYRVTREGVEAAGELRTRGKAVSGLAFSADGAKVVTFTDGQALQVWDTGTLECLEAPESGRYPVEQAVVSPNWKHVAAATRGRMLWLWDFETGADLDKVRCQAAPEDFSPDGGLLVAKAHGYRGEGIKLFRVGSGGLKDLNLRLQELDLGYVTSDWAGSPRFAAGGARIFTGGPSGVYIWETRTGGFVHRIRVGARRFSPSADGERLLVVGFGGSVCIWRRHHWEHIWGAVLRREALGVLLFMVLLVWSFRSDSRTYWQKAREAGAKHAEERLRSKVQKRSAPVETETAEDAPSESGAGSGEAGGPEENAPPGP